MEEFTEDLITEAYNEIQKKKSFPIKSGGSRSEKNNRKEKLQKVKFERKLKNANSKKLGFTNKLAISLVFIMVLSLFMGFSLACLSIQHQFTGALACFTVCVTPLDTCLGIVLCRVVDKSKAENLGADGSGISYMTAKAALSQETNGTNIFDDSPPI